MEAAAAQEPFHLHPPFAALEWGFQPWGEMSVCPVKGERLLGEAEEFRATASDELAVHGCQLQCVPPGRGKPLCLLTLLRHGLRVSRSHAHHEV